MKYTTAFGDKLCQVTAKSSIGLRLICEQLKVPYSTVTSWVYDPQHELHSKYIQAKQMQLHVLAEEIIEIIDDHTNDYMEVIRNGKKKIILNKEHIWRTRLRIKARMDIIIKLAPILYPVKAEKIKHTVHMPPPPERKTTSPMPEQDHQPVPVEQPINQSTIQPVNHHSSPKTPPNPLKASNSQIRSRAKKYLNNRHPGAHGAAQKNLAA